MEKAKYRTIDERDLSDFDRKLNNMVSEGWSPCGNIITYTDNRGHSHFVMSMMFFKNE